MLGVGAFRTSRASAGGQTATSPNNRRRRFSALVFRLSLKTYGVPMIARPRGPFTLFLLERAIDIRCEFRNLLAFQILGPPSEFYTHVALTVGPLGMQKQPR